MKFSQVFEKLLNEEQGDESLKETIAKSIAEKASGGDLSAIKLLRDMVGEEKDAPTEIKITVIE